MSDALLTEISKKLSDIHTALKGGTAPAAAGGKPATPPAGAGTAGKPATAAPGTAAGKAPGTAATAGKPATAAGNKAAGSAPAAGAKAAGGKHTAEEVREIIKKVATNKALGRDAAINILDENAGVQNVSSIKPENFDAVYEACEVELAGVAGSEGVSDDPLA